MGDEPVVAIVDWTHLIEDFLDNIGVSFDAFCNEMTGGWLFGYIDALRSAGVSSVLICVSARVTNTTRYTHQPTGATICVLPAPRTYRFIRRRILNPYAATIEEAAGNVRAFRRVLLKLMKSVAPYLSTPLLSLARELRRQRVTTILCQDYDHGRFDVCVLVGKLMRRRVFATFQGGQSLPRKAAINACDGLAIATSSEAARIAKLYPPVRVARIFNPLSLDEWSAGDPADGRALLNITSEARVAAWHGRVDLHRKGLDVLFDAWERVCEQRCERDLRLLLIGSGNDSAALRELLAKKKPRGLLWIDEYLNDRALMRRYLSAADVYVFPSRHEGFPVAPLEAMALGLPVVAADAPGVPDIFERGEASGGVIVPRGDVAALTASLGRLLDDDALARTIGDCGRRRVEQSFSLESVGARLREFLIV